MRIISAPHPQETVAHGLALMGVPIETIRRAANNAWFALQVSISEPILLQMTEIGERLPIHKYVGGRLNANYKIDYEIPIRWTPGFGSELETAIWYDPQETELRTENIWEDILVAFGQELLGQVKDTADILLEVDVDETEHLTAVGLIKGGESFKNVRFFTVNRDEPAEEEKRQLRQMYQESKMQLAVA